MQGPPEVGRRGIPAGNAPPLGFKLAVLCSGHLPTEDCKLPGKLVWACEHLCIGKQRGGEILAKLPGLTSTGPGDRRVNSAQGQARQLDALLDFLSF